MTVYKKHTTPEGDSGVCTAKVKCRYGGETNHFYYDSSIKQEVLNPADPKQKEIDNVPSAELLDKASDLLPAGTEASEEFKAQHAVTAKLTEAYEKDKEKIISSYPMKHRDSVRMLTGIHEGAGMIASFDIFDPEEDDYTAKSDASDDEKRNFAQSYLKKFKAESRLRSFISASHI